MSKNKIGIEQKMSKWSSNHTENRTVDTNMKGLDKLDWKLSVGNSGSEIG